VVPVTPSLSDFNIPTITLRISNLNYTIIPPLTNSNGAFTYYVTNQRASLSNVIFVSVNGNVLTFIGGGTATVFANQAPDGVYGEGTISTSLYVISDIL
jgi:hypothetical protein